MLRRIPLHHSDEAITAIREDGAVILTDFASPEQVDQVDQDTRNVMAARMQDEVRLPRPAALLWPRTAQRGGGLLTGLTPRDGKHDTTAGFMLGSSTDAARRRGSSGSSTAISFPS